VHCRYLSETDFVSAIAPTGDFAKIGRQQYGILFHIADKRKRGKVTWEDFVAFETTLKRPDAEFDVRNLRCIGRYEPTD
jgi:solute carrier family 25 (mitochondrial aspartate/glutamate transporter), member 12/13